jgi:hypothetical protein
MSGARAESPATASRACPLHRIDGISLMPGYSWPSREETLRRSPRWQRHLRVLGSALVSAGAPNNGDLPSCNELRASHPGPSNHLSSKSLTKANVERKSVIKSTGDRGQRSYQTRIILMPQER